MGRLIDADELLKEFDPNGERLDPILVRSRIVQQPTAYNVDAVVKQLEEKESEWWDTYSLSSRFDEYANGKSVGFEEAIDIVKRGGVE